MSQNQDAIGAAGLWPSPNHLSEVPAGAFVRLDNCVIRSKGVIEPRPGHAQLADLSSYPLGATRVPKAIGAIGVGSSSGIIGNLLVHAGTDVISAYAVIDSNVSAPDETKKRMAFLSANGRAYYTTSDGVVRYDGTTVAPAGGLRCDVNWTHSNLASDANGFLPADSAVRYRATLTTLDAAGREIVGPPSGSVIITNPAPQLSAIGGLVRTGGTTVTVTTPTAHHFKAGSTFSVSPGEANFAAGDYVVAAVTGETTFTYADAGSNVASTLAQTVTIGTAKCAVTVLLPDGATEQTIVRLYRSPTAATVGTVPSEDCYLVNESSPPSGFGSGLVIEDNTPEVMLGPIGYFSPSAETELGANSQPPLAHDIALLDDVTFYAKTREPHGLTLRLIATGGTSGLAPGDTITITLLSVDHVYTGSDGVAGGDFIVYNTNSVALDAERTAQSICDAINSDGSGPCWAQYVSAVDDAPGQIRLIARTFDAAAFTVKCDAPDAFNPTLPDAAPKASTQELRGNRVFYSKPGMPDAVPALNFIDIGDGSEEIERVIELRSKLFIIKTHSVYTLSGSYGRYNIDRVDKTMVSGGADTFAVVSGQIYGLSTQGVVTISEVGLGLIGLPVQGEISPLLSNDGLLTGNAIEATRRLAWGCSHETSHLYLLGLPGNTTDTACQNVWVFSTLAKAWMLWPVARSCGVVESVSDALVMGSAETSEVLYEYPRQFDRALDAVIDSSAVNSTTGLWELTMADASFIEPGDVINANTAPYPTGIVLSKTGSVLTVGGSNMWTSGAASVGQAFECVIEPVPFFMGSAGTDKQLQEVSLLFKDSNYRLLNVTVGSDMSPARLLSRQLSAPGFGETAWGSSGWGNRRSPANERLLVPRNSARGHYFYVRASIREASRWALNGLSVMFDQNDKGKR